MNKSQGNESAGILLAVDGSPAAKSAAFAAAGVASALQWGIHAAYVVDLSQAFDLFGGSEGAAVVPNDDELSNAERVAKLEERGNAALAEVHALCSATNTPFSSEMVLGEVADILLESAAHYRLLALGRKGFSGRDDPDHVGANFKQVAGRAGIPLLVGHEDRQQEFLRALLVYDGSDASKEAEAWAGRLQSMFMEVVVAAIPGGGSHDPEPLAETRRTLSAGALQHYELVEVAEASPAGIAALAASRQADMILMPDASLPGLRGLTDPSLVVAMSRIVRVPILAAR